MKGKKEKHPMYTMRHGTNPFLRLFIFPLSKNKRKRTLQGKNNTTLETLSMLVCCLFISFEQIICNEIEWARSIYAAAYFVFLSVIGLTSSNISLAISLSVPLKGTPNSKSLATTLEKSSKNFSLSSAYVTTHFLKALS